MERGVDGFMTIRDFLTIIPSCKQDKICIINWEGKTALESIRIERLHISWIAYEIKDICIVPVDGVQTVEYLIRIENSKLFQNKTWIDKFLRERKE